MSNGDQTFRLAGLAMHKATSVRLLAAAFGGVTLRYKDLFMQTT